MAAVAHDEGGARHEGVVVGEVDEVRVRWSRQFGEIDDAAGRGDDVHRQRDERVDRPLQHLGAALLGHGAEAEEHEWGRVGIVPGQGRRCGVAFGGEDRHAVLTTLVQLVAGSPSKAPNVLTCSTSRLPHNVSRSGSASNPARCRDSLCNVKLACHAPWRWSKNVWRITAVGRSNRGATASAALNIASMTTTSGSRSPTSATSSSPAAGELVNPKTEASGWNE